TSNTGTPNASPTSAPSPAASASRTAQSLTGSGASVTAPPPRSTRARSLRPPPLPHHRAGRRSATGSEVECRWTYDNVERCGRPLRADDVKFTRPTRGDVIAGISVALVLVPQALAYAELAGLPA